MSTDSLYATAAHYGVQFSGTLVDGSYHDEVDSHAALTLKQVAAAKGKVTRIRILSERGLGDISYVHATLPEPLPSGCRIVRVVDHPGQVRMRSRKAEMIEWAKRAGVFAKGLGLLDDNNYSIMY